jgi:uncharacterized membrane protein
MTDEISESREIDSPSGPLIIASQFHEGPLPTPEVMKAYDEICPGAARDILEMAKTHQSHDVWMDQRDMRRLMRQDIFSFILGLIGQLGSIAITVLGFCMSYIYIKAGEPKLGYSTAAIAITICGYLIWWKTHTSDNEE